jgi:hypothetical protein
MSALLTIELSANGVERVVSRPRNVHEARAIADLQAKAALAIRLLDETIRESASEPPPAKSGDDHDLTGNTSIRN